MAADVLGKGLKIKQEGTMPEEIEKFVSKLDTTKPTVAVSVKTWTKRAAVTAGILITSVIGTKEIYDTDYAADAEIVTVADSVEADGKVSRKYESFDKVDIAHKGQTVRVLIFVDGIVVSEIIREITEDADSGKVLTITAPLYIYEDDTTSVDTAAINPKRE
jgi:hypothetical protein